MLSELSNATWIGISVVSKLEFLSFGELSQNDRDLFGEFQRRVETIGLGVQDEMLLQATIDLRRDHRLKLPDAIIVATALNASATLVTADAHFKRVTGLNIVDSF